MVLGVCQPKHQHYHPHARRRKYLYVEAVLPFAKCATAARPLLSFAKLPHNHHRASDAFVLVLDLGAAPLLSLVFLSFSFFFSERSFADK